MLRGRPPPPPLKPLQELQDGPPPPPMSPGSSSLSSSPLTSARSAATTPTAAATATQQQQQPGDALLLADDSPAAADCCATSRASSRLARVLYEPITVALFFLAVFVVGALAVSKLVSTDRCSAADLDVVTELASRTHAIELFMSGSAVGAFLIQVRAAG